jgi:hypothetical protein
MARFFLDNDFPLGVGVALARVGHDVTSARSTNREHRRDDDQLLHASHEQRIILTHNKRDFELLHDAWHRWSRSWGVQSVHGGIIVIHQGWSHRRYAFVINDFLATYPDLTNRMHLCDFRGNWIERPAPPL